MNERRDFAALGSRSRATRAAGVLGRRGPGEAARERDAASGCGLAYVGVLAAAFALAGCSPWAAARGARDAERAVHAAEQARADEHAPYELTLAKLYLSKAREEAAEAHYAAALKWIAQSSHHARGALVRAERGGGVPR